MKRSCIFLLAIALIFILAGAVYAAGNVSVYVDNKAVSFPDQKPYIDGNNRTLVPIRFIAEEMGAEVDWDGAEQLVTITQNDTIIKLTIGERRASVNGNWKYFDTSAVIYNDRTMVPLRFISETLGADVDWEAKTKTVYIWTGKVPKKPVKPEIPLFSGQPMNLNEWTMKNQSGTLADSEYARFQDNPQIQYVSADELPIAMGREGGLIIWDLEVDDKWITFTFETHNGYKFVPGIDIAQGKYIAGSRTNNTITDLGGNRYKNSYTVNPTWSPGNNVRDFTHFLISYGNNFLAVENPLCRR